MKCHTIEFVLLRERGKRNEAEGKSGKRWKERGMKRCFWVEGKRQC